MSQPNGNGVKAWALGILGTLIVAGVSGAVAASWQSNADVSGLAVEVKALGQRIEDLQQWLREDRAEVRRRLERLERSRAAGLP